MEYYYRYLINKNTELDCILNTVHRGVLQNWYFMYLPDGEPGDDIYGQAVPVLNIQEWEF